MTLNKYGFIVKGPGYDPSYHHARLESPEFMTVVLGVSTSEKAISAAQELVKDGIQLIEICGGFDLETKVRIEKAIGFVIPVGMVGYSDGE